MATGTLGQKTNRIDIRMSDEQKRQIEEAASLSGLSVSQWSLGHLLSIAREEILRSNTISLTTESFDAFAALLDEPADPTFARFAEEKTIWE